jgi:hypothetical protein
MPDYSATHAGWRTVSGDVYVLDGETPHAGETITFRGGPSAALVAAALRLQRSAILATREGGGNLSPEDVPGFVEDLLTCCRGLADRVAEWTWAEDGVALEPTAEAFLELDIRELMFMVSALLSVADLPPVD